MFLSPLIITNPERPFFRGFFIYMWVSLIQELKGKFDSQRGLVHPYFNPDSAARLGIGGAHLEVACFHVARAGCGGQEDVPVNC
jgi:hypothetical protein